MKCPHCTRTGKMLVQESRPHGGNVYRRRLCACGKSFVTVETAPAGLTMPTEVRNSHARRGEHDPRVGRATPGGDGAHLQGVWR